MTTELTKEQQSDKVFITRPDRGSGWPNWPFLPVKRYPTDGTGIETALIVDRTPLGVEVDPAAPCYRTLHFVNLWSLTSSDRVEREMAVARLRDPKHQKTYTSVDEMLADGWQVD